MGGHGLVSVLPGRRRGDSRRGGSDLAQDFQAVFYVPHPGKDLHHAAEVSLHGAILDTGFIGRQCAHTEMVCKPLESWDGVGDPREVWVEGKPGSEVQPFSPGGSSGAIPDGADSFSLFLLRSMEVLLPFTSGGTRQSHQ